MPARGGQGLPLTKAFRGRPVTQPLLVSLNLFLLELPLCMLMGHLEGFRVDFKLFQGVFLVVQSPPENNDLFSL